MSPKIPKANALYLVTYVVDARTVRTAKPCLAVCGCRPLLRSPERASSAPAPLLYRPAVVRPQLRAFAPSWHTGVRTRHAVHKLFGASAQEPIGFDRACLWASGEGTALRAYAPEVECARKQSLRATSVNLDDRPSWSRNSLKRLGEALATGVPAPAECPQYGEVMAWHNELASEVATQISNGLWATMPADQLDVSARPKTIDTLVQKLQRESFSLADVQDLAGVRIDADLNLTQQTQLAREIADHFGVPDNLVRDLRESPHSGYRAVHVWIRKPAGRVEVQIRTVAQSAWANAYERLGDRFGREIRYGGVHDRPEVQHLVTVLHDMSAAVAKIEQREVQIADITAKLDDARRLGDDIPKLGIPSLLLLLMLPSNWRRLCHVVSNRRKLRGMQRELVPMQRTVDELVAENLASRATYVQSLHDVRRRLDREGVE